MSWLRRYVLNNLLMKLISLGSAVLLWSAIANEPQVEVTLRPSLVFRNMPQGMELSTEAPTSVQVRVSGPAATVRQLSERDLAVSLNMSEFERPGERSFPLTAADVQTPPRVRVMHIIPAQVRVSFEARAQREIPIVPRIGGQFATRYQLAGYQLSSPAVRVVGPESHVAALESATTDPVDVTGVIARAQFEVHTVVPDPLVRIVGPQSVWVTVQMERRR